MTSPIDLSEFPTAAPARPTTELRFADVAVTATANEFKGIYRGKQCHEPDFVHTLDRAKEAGVSKVMLTGMSLADVSFNEGIAKTRPSQCYLTIGVHPYHASELDEGGESYLNELEQKVKNALAQDPVQIAAFGELGLDYDREVHASKEVQIKAFKAQLDLFVANGWDLPLFLHCRAAFDDFVEIITPYMDKLPRRGLVHSFVGSTAQMEKLVSLGLDVSVNGFSFKDLESLQMTAKIPLESLQLETDAPWGELKPTAEVVKQYCTNARALPQSKKKDKWDEKCMIKERNESCTMERVALVVAGLKGVSVDEVAEAAWRNSVKMFGLGRR
ncbi:family hydrolase [Fusarium albosuccineum]|uniref:Family hydrolase n=1 Tax=Fusarium albosuccineum TaxID=1237068 RepID=A0A8H4LK42_9HYPO|nr:family hydrolase [Fusarium albosuccineum]